MCAYSLLKTCSTHKTKHQDEHFKTTHSTQKRNPRRARDRSAGPCGRLLAPRLGQHCTQLRTRQTDSAEGQRDKQRRQTGRQAAKQTHSRPTAGQRATAGHRTTLTRCSGGRQLKPPSAYLAAVPAEDPRARWLVERVIQLVLHIPRIRLSISQNQQNSIRASQAHHWHPHRERRPSPRVDTTGRTSWNEWDDVSLSVSLPLCLSACLWIPLSLYISLQLSLCPSVSTAIQTPPQRAEQ
eukprot:COSAG02_NODE_342_length_24167_cov_5.061118_17_plen_239_part_00